VALRGVACGGQFLNPTPVLNENLLLFPRDMSQEFTLPRFGLVFKRTGWQPFYDPNFFTFKFEQGYAGRASNSSYVDLGNTACSFVDPHGRIIEDAARCPSADSHVVGTFFDTSFRFVRVTLLRCHNGTDADGRTQPGTCRTPEEIDKLVYEGTITLGVAQEDLDADSVSPFQNLLTFKKQFIDRVHPTYDVYFTIRSVTQAPRAFFDSLAEDAYREFVIFDKMEASFTDFRAERIGRWNQADPDFVPQYASFFLLLAEEKIDQQRSFGSVFALIESWGASVCFFYALFTVLATRWNSSHFNAQVKGLDLRDLKTNQFNHFGRLMDTSFQVPRELQDMAS